MNIVIVTPFFNETPNRKSSLIRLAKELSKYGNITIISSKVEHTSSLEILNHNLKIFRFKPTIYFPKLPYTIDIFQFKKILDVCKKEKCDLIIAYSIQFFSCFSAALAAKLGGYPFICRIVGASKTTNKFGLDFLSKIYDYTFGKITLKFADKIIVQSKNMKKRPLQLGALFSKINIVEDGVDLYEFQKNNDFSFLKNELNISDSKIIITFISRIFELKGILDFLEVAKKIVQTNRKALFLIVGKGSLEKKVMKIANKFENIIFLGYRNDIPSLLAISDIFVLPSYSEGLSPAILEAFASGLPVITTKVGSNTDIIINGKNGFLINPGDIQLLYDYLITLIEDKNLRIKMGEYNRILIKDEFNLKKSTLKFLNELKNTLYSYRKNL